MTFQLSYQPVDLSQENTEYLGHVEHQDIGDDSSQKGQYQHGYEMNDLNE